jgi:hypothetical protein
VKTSNHPRLNLSLRIFCLCGLLAIKATVSFAQKVADQPVKRTSDRHVPGPFPVRYETTDNRIAVIGDQTPTNGGWSFDNSHIKPCWLADGFNFNGYDFLYIMPTTSAVTVKPEDQAIYDLAKQRVLSELSRALHAKSLFTVVTNEADLKPGAKVLKLENTITEFYKGSSGGRFWAGEFGAGQPVLRVHSRMTDGQKEVFVGDSRRSGVSAGARVGIMKNEDIQFQDIQSMTLDIADFVSAIAGQYTPKK